MKPPTKFVPAPDGTPGEKKDASAETSPEVSAVQYPVPKEPQVSVRFIVVVLLLLAVVFFAFKFAPH